jgi:hypothetical protein
MDQFYLTLPSNSSKNIHTDNTKSSYKVELNSAIIFDKEFEVGLCEIQIPGIIEDVVLLGTIIIRIPSNLYYTESKCDIYSNSFDDKNLNTITDRINQRIEMQIANLLSPELRPKIIAIEGLNGSLKFKFNQFLADVEVFFTGGISDILGFKASSRRENAYGPGAISENELFVNEFKQMNFHNNTLFVYTDIIKYQHVGEFMAQLIRTVHFEISESRRSQIVTFNNPHYVQLATDYVDSVEITIKDGQDNPIKFISGIQPTIIKLHFRPKF